MHVLITRPEADAEAWRARLEAEGVAVSVDPMLAIAEEPPAKIDPRAYQGLIVTSRNAIRWLATCPNLPELLDLPVFAVGLASTADARGLGFRRVETGAGTARDLVQPIRTQARPGGKPLLHLSGDKIAFDLREALHFDGFPVERRVVYRSRPAGGLREATVAGLETGAIGAVTLLSPLSAQTWLDLVAKADLSQHHQRLLYICLSLPIAATLAGVKPREVLVADRPAADAVLDAIIAVSRRADAC